MAQTLYRGLSILRLLARTQAEGLRVSDIARRLGLAKATAVRLARALAAEGFVVQDPDDLRYRLGPEALAVGLAAEPGYVIHRVAAPAVHELAMATGDWTCFSVRAGLEAICLSVERGDLPLPPSVLRVGDRYPLGVSSAGLAMLASLSDDSLQEVLACNAKHIERAYPQLSISLIRRQVDETRRRGYSLIPGLLLPGYWAVGVALVRRDGAPLAALSLVGPASRMGPTRCAVVTERMRRLADEVMVQSSTGAGE